ncbi:MAG: hypothetical protein HQ514_05010 [Rhodospirillales bacterium]|nr:hypothetical protein [Rhodospirillales bacterium]
MKFVIFPAVLLAGALSVVMVTAVGAVDIVNNDAVVHEFVVVEDGMSIADEIDPGEIVAEICDKCVIQFEGFGEVEAVGAERVVITSDSILVER